MLLVTKHTRIRRGLWVILQSEAREAEEAAEVEAKALKKKKQELMKPKTGGTIGRYVNKPKSTSVDAILKKRKAPSATGDDSLAGVASLPGKLSICFKVNY